MRIFSRDLKGAAGTLAVSLAASGLLLASVPGPTRAQTAATAPPAPQEAVREVISKEVSVGSREAALRLEFADGGTLDLAFEDGEVRIDGETSGSYESGGGLETAWRALLSTAVSLDDGPLAEALLGWEPPATLEGDALDAARRLDRSLEGALAAAASPRVPAAPTSQEALTRLLGRTDRLTGLAVALDDVDLDELMLRVDEDVRIGPEVELDATLVVVDGDAEIEGVVRGDVVVVDGTLRLADDARVEGDVRLVDARLLGDESRIQGELVEVGDEIAVTIPSEEEIRERIRDEVRSELRSEMRDVRRDRGWGVFTPLRNVLRGLGSVFAAFMNLAVFGLLAGIAVYFGRDELEVVSETVERGPARAGMVGLAGAFLSLPAWILGIVALAITIIGIPVMLAWIPLFPLAVLLAVGFGLTAVAGTLGDRVAAQRFAWLSWVRSSNPYTRVAGGLLLLGSPFILAGVVEMVGFLGFVEGLLRAVGWVAVSVSGLVGFGAVLLTRAGRRPEYYRAGATDDVGEWMDDFTSTRRSAAGGSEWFGAGSDAAGAPGASGPDEGEPAAGTPGSGPSASGAGSREPPAGGTAYGETPDARGHEAHAEGAAPAEGDESPGSGPTEDRTPHDDEHEPDDPRPGA